MSSTPGLVASTVPFSVVDGPGSRFVLFLQGCNFDCTACHNPSTIDLHPGPGVAGERTVDEIIGQLREVAPFLSGITVSGGEPTLQMDFLVELFEAIKSDRELNHLTTLIDTNGTAPEIHWAKLAPVLDGAMVDLKAASPDLHLQLTGKGNASVKDSIRWLWEHRKLTEVRLLVVQGVTDDSGELGEWSAFVADIDPSIRVRLMGFRHLGVRSAARQWPETTDDLLEKVRDRMRAYGLRHVVAEVTSVSPVG